MSVSTMADHVGACAAALTPLYELIKAQVFAAERIHGDDTTVPVLAKVKTRTGRRCGTYVRDDRPFGGADPPSVDVTAHVVEAFGKLGISRNHPAMVRALAYLKREQELDGAWFGRWGVKLSLWYGGPCCRRSPRSARIWCALRRAARATG